MTIQVTNGKGYFYQRSALIAGSQNVAHGLTATPGCVVAYAENADGKIAQGTHTSTNLVLNPASSGKTCVILAF